MDSRSRDFRTEVAPPGDRPLSMVSHTPVRSPSPYIPRWPHPPLAGSPAGARTPAERDFAARQGREVLFVCFNRPLAERVRNAALINTAAAATTAAMANRKRRDQAGDKLTDELWLAFERAHLACLDLRDRKIAALNLPANGTADIFKALYAQQADNES